MVVRGKDPRQRGRELEILRWVDKAMLEDMKSNMGRIKNKVEGPGKVHPCSEILNPITSSQFFPSSLFTVVVEFYLCGLLIILYSRHHRLSYCID